jgi:O-antigen ligase
MVAGTAATTKYPLFYGRQLVLGVTFFSIILIRLQVLIGHQTEVAPMVLLILLACVWWGLANSKPIPHRGALYAVLAYVACIDIGVVRGSLAGVYVNKDHAISQSLTYLAVLLVGYFLITTSRTQKDHRQAFAAIALAPGVYALANALLYIAGVKSATVGINEQNIGTLQKASLLELFHIHMFRVQFPMATGVNSTGIVAGAGLAGCLVLISRRGAPRWLTLPCAAGCLYCLLLGDNRTALFIAVIAGLYFSWTRRASASRWIAAAVPVLPILLILGVALLNGIAGSKLSRGSTTNFESGNNRFHIWEAAWSMLRHPSVQQLYGWGDNAQITSGVSERYAYLFASLPHPLTYSTHNLVIQTIFDEGYVGLLIVVLAAWVTASRLLRYIRSEPSPLANALMAVLAVTLLSGTTEVSPSYGTEEALIATLLVMGAAAGLTVSRKRARDLPDLAAKTGDVEESPSPSRTRVLAGVRALA